MQVVLDLQRQIAEIRDTQSRIAALISPCYQYLRHIEQMFRQMAPQWGIDTSMLPEVAVVDHFPGETSQRTPVQEEEDPQVQQFVEDPLLNQDDYLVDTAAATEDREKSMNAKIPVPKTGAKDDA